MCLFVSTISRSPVEVKCFFETPCTCGRTGTGWQRNATNVRLKADEETSHCRETSAGTRVEREVDDG